MVCGLDSIGFELDAARHRDRVYLHRLGAGKNEGGYGMDKGNLLLA